MKIETILKNVEMKRIIGKLNNQNISHLSCSTKDIKKNSLFFCLSGTEFDGHDFADIAVKRGAIILVCERPLDCDITQIIVEDSRIAMSIMASNFFGNPREKLKLIGITGTNGKTTTTYMIQSILKSAGKKVGVIGTIGIVINETKLPAKLTTPDPIELHSIFLEMVKQKVEYVVMEVSAHAIYLNKMFNIICDVGVLTNITEDHLDFFNTFDIYKKTKQSFIAKKFCKKAVINSDDKYFNETLSLTDLDEIYSYGLKNPSDVFAFDYNFSTFGTHYFLNLFDEICELKTKQLGKFNLYNAICSATVCKLFNIDTKDIVCGLENLKNVLGRFDVKKIKDKTVIIDYAHTPDGLKNILLSTKDITTGKVVCVFGCGGNREKQKRSIMGEISAKLADYVVITTDNPRFENPSDIIFEIEQGVKKYTKNYLCIENRREAIFYALSLLKKDDVCVIAGKGAEDYIEIKGVRYPYSDYDVCENYKKES